MILESVTYGFLFIMLYFQVFLLLTYFEKRNSFGYAKSETDYSPTVTILVPCFNEETTLAITVESLLNLDYPSDQLSIYLIDDGSTDSTAEVMHKYASGYPQIKTFHKENGGKWRALNFGLEHTTSEFVGCLDADSFVDKGALREIMHHFQTHPDVMTVTPSMRIWRPNTLVRKMQNSEYDLGVFVRKTLSLLNAIHITPGPFSIFRKKVFDSIGPYRHAHNTEDLEIAMRMQKAGMKIGNAHKAIVYTVGPANAYRLYKQRVRWTGGYLKNMVDYRNMIFSRKFGHLSLIVLPMTVMSVITALFLFSIFALSIIKGIFKMMEKLLLVGLPDLSFKFDINWFFIDVKIVTFVTIFLLGTVVLSIFIGRMLTNNKKLITLDLVSFICLYSFISPFWLVTSVYNTVMSRETKWR